MEKLNIALVSSEVAPFAKTGGLADVAGSLPPALKSLGCNVSVFLPYYRQVKDKDLTIKPLKNKLSVRSEGSDVEFSLYVCKNKGVDFYLIKKDEYFDREFLYGTSKEDYPDNALRFSFFAQAVLFSLVSLGVKPDVIHCNDWQSALIPFYLKHGSHDLGRLKDARVLFTIHNMAYQGVFPKDVMPQIGIGEEFFTPERLEFYGKLSFMKSGILYSEAISTVSKGYAKEILTPEYGCGLDGLLNVRKNDLYGIVNGADYSDWSPVTDKFIKVNYDSKDIEGKLKCKKDLMSQMKVKGDADAPLLGIVSRLAGQKGIDIIVESVPDMIKLGCNLVILGTGDEKYHKLLNQLAKKYPKNIGIKIGFDNSLAHKIEAGCDMFLMPSRYEPCGLNQIYSLRYGTIPVVRATGGLEDTIIDYSADSAKGNGFKFSKAEKGDFLGALNRAVKVYGNKKKWKELMLRAMKYDFSWETSAREYIRVYGIIKARSAVMVQ